MKEIPTNEFPKTLIDFILKQFPEFLYGISGIELINGVYLKNRICKVFPQTTLAFDPEGVMTFLKDYVVSVYIPDSAALVTLK